MDRRGIFNKNYKIIFVFALIFLTGCAARKRDLVISTAQSQIGVPYVYGGYSPNKGFDCSGLVYYSYRAQGIKVPRVTMELYKNSKTVRFSHLKRGDLIFFNINRRWWRPFGKPDHVGIYVGKGEMIHAPRTGKSVEVVNFKNNKYWQSRLVGVKRVI